MKYNFSQYIFLFVLCSFYIADEMCDKDPIHSNENVCGIDRA